MKYLLAGLTVIGLALFWNRCWRQIGFNEPFRMVFFIPLGEELSKYYVAYLFQLNPFWISAIFGSGEGFYEMVHITKHSRPVLLFAALLTHSVLGLGYLINGKVLPGLAIAFILHSGWNAAVYFYSCNRMK